MNEVLTVRQAAAWLKVHPCTVYRLLKKRAIPAIRIGFYWRISRRDLKLWMEQGTSTQRKFTRPPDRTQHAVSMSLKPK